MIFIVIVIALLMERFFHWHHLRHWHWFRYYESWLMKHIGNWPAILLLFCNILPFLIIVGLVSHFFQGILFGIPEFIFGVVVILYCLGPENLWVQTYRCIHDLQKEKADAVLHGAEHSQQFHKKFVHAIFLAAHQRIFAILFWFVILGPVGAVLYRMIDSYRMQSVSHLDKICFYIAGYMDWVSIRFFTFLFALAGHFTNVFSCWKPNVFKGMQMNDALLTDCGLAAIDSLSHPIIPATGEAETEAIQLIDRVFIIALVILALIVLATSF